MQEWEKSLFCLESWNLFVLLFPALYSVSVTSNKWTVSSCSWPNWSTDPLVFAVDRLCYQPLSPQLCQGSRVYLYAGPACQHTQHCIAIPPTVYKDWDIHSAVTFIHSPDAFLPAFGQISLFLQSRPHKCLLTVIIKKVNNFQLFSLRVMVLHIWSQPVVRLTVWTSSNK